MSGRRGEIQRRKEATEKAMLLLLQAQDLESPQGYNPETSKEATAKAYAMMNECLTILRETKQSHHEMMVPALSFAAHLAECLSDPKTSQALYQEALGLLKSKKPWTLPVQDQIAKMEGNVATHLYHQGRWDESEALFRLSLTREGLEIPVRGVHLHSLAKIALRKGDLVEAEDLCLQAFTEANKAFNAMDRQGFVLRAGTLSTLASVFEIQGKVAAADSLDQDALGLAIRRGPNGLPLGLECGVPIISSLRRAGASFLERGMPDKAEQILVHAYSIYRGQVEDFALTMGTELQPCFRAAKVYVRALRALGKEALGIQIVKDIEESEAKLEAKFKSALEETRRELAKEKKDGGSGSSSGGAAAAGSSSEGGGVRWKARLSRKQKKRKAKKAAKKTVEGNGGKEREREKAETEEKESTPSMDEVGEALSDVTIAGKPARREEKEGSAGKEEAVENEEEEAVENEEKEEQLECSLCLCEVDPKTDKDHWILKCRHLYHKSCIDKWLDKCLEKKIQPSCPMCRAPIISQ